MIKEGNLGITYDSIDTETFVSLGIVFLIIYRIGLFLYSIYDWLADDGEWCHCLLVFLDLYVHIPLYESLCDTQSVPTLRAQRKAEKRDIKKQSETQIEMGTANDNDVSDVDSEQASVDIARAFRSTDGCEPAPNENGQILPEPSDTLMYVQLAESIAESMPMIVLQSVFIIQSANDDYLKSVSLLITFSVIANLCTISSDFVWLDSSKVCGLYSK